MMPRVSIVKPSNQRTFKMRGYCVVYPVVRSVFWAACRRVPCKKSYWLCQTSSSTNPWPWGHSMLSHCTCRMSDFSQVMSTNQDAPRSLQRVPARPGSLLILNRSIRQQHIGQRML